MVSVVVAQNSNQYHNRGRSEGLILSPPRGFKGINCLIFDSNTGILALPSDVLYPSFGTPPLKKHPSFYYGLPKSSNKSKPIPTSSIPANREETVFAHDFLYSELWAGPTYSNSPPPSLLPIPTFSLRQKCSVSFELPAFDHIIKVHPFAKSAPSSPTKDPSSSLSNDFFFNNVSATENLRRILHLDVNDESANQVCGG